VVIAVGGFRTVTGMAAARFLRLPSEFTSTVITASAAPARFLMLAGITASAEFDSVLIATGFTGGTNVARCFFLRFVAVACVARFLRFFMMASRCN
jgi:hypothetical protein